MEVGLSLGGGVCVLMICPFVSWGLRIGDGVEEREKEEEREESEAGWLCVAALPAVRETFFQFR